jgi:hypothetical protein
MAFGPSPTDPASIIAKGIIGFGGAEHQVLRQWLDDLSFVAHGRLDAGKAATPANFGLMHDLRDYRRERCFGFDMRRVVAVDHDAKLGELVAQHWEGGHANSGIMTLGSRHDTRDVIRVPPLGVSVPKIQ